MLILSIESSCDDLSLSIIKDYKIIDCITLSQESFHSNNGGIIPEFASRLHLININIILNKIKKYINLLKQLDYISYTKKPGLIGSLIVGRILAESIALFFKKKVFQCNHLYGHIYSCFIDKIEKISFPLLGIVISGGHTSMYIMKKHLSFELIGESLDDAIGECLDKVGRSLKLKYPGAKEIDKLSKKANKKSIYNFTIPNVKDFNLSYSGLKTQGFLKWKNEVDKSIENKSNFCYFFQKACFEQLFKKIKKILLKYDDIKTIAIGGGVSANSYFRENIYKLKKQILIPKLEYTQDNAAMIALLSVFKVKENTYD